MDRQEVIEKIISIFSNMDDYRLLDELNYLDSELGNEILGDDRLWRMDVDLPDFCAGMDGIEVYGYFVSGRDADAGGPFDTDRLYFGGYTFIDGAGSLEGMYSTDKFTYRDFLTADFVEALISNYDRLSDHLPIKVCELIESI